MRARLFAAGAVVTALAFAPSALAQPAPPLPAPPGDPVPSAGTPQRAPADPAPPTTNTDPDPPPDPVPPPQDAKKPPAVPDDVPDRIRPTSDDPDDAYEPDDQLRAIGEPEPDPSQHRYFPLNVSFIYPLATNVGDPNRATNIDIGVLFTKIGYLYGGVQTGMLASVSQRMVGLQIGLGTVSEGRTEGGQIAGGFAIADAPMNGLQLGGVFSWSRFRFNGVQISGVANQARKHFAGLQIAGGINIARKTAHGAQIGGLMNIGGIEGVQIAPINISDDVNGVQIGIVNVARKVRGLQIGLVNVASELDGESIGAASVPRSGGIHGAVWGSNSLYGNYGIKFASRFTYSIFSGAFHFEGKDKLMGPGFTFGFAHPVLTSLLPGLFVQADVGGYRLFRLEGAQRAHDELYKTRLIVRYALVRHLSMFVGGGAYFGLRSSDDPAATSITTRFGPELDAGIDL